MTDTIDSKLTRTIQKLYLRHTVLDKDQFRSEQQEWLDEIHQIFEDAGYVAPQEQS